MDPSQHPVKRLPFITVFLATLVFDSGLLRAAPAGDASPASSAVREAPVMASTEKRGAGWTSSDRKRFRAGNTDGMGWCAINEDRLL